jgi:glycosyltransferase involved in cell wall biosynthesis
MPSVHERRRILCVFPAYSPSFGMGRAVVDGETGLVLPGNDAAPWVEAAAMLAGDRERRQHMGRSARRHAERGVPSWATVLAEDLLPLWQIAAAVRQAKEASAAA